MLPLPRLDFSLIIISIDPYFILWNESTEKSSFYWYIAKRAWWQLFRDFIELTTSASANGRKWFFFQGPYTYVHFLDYLPNSYSTILQNGGFHFTSSVVINGGISSSTDRNSFHRSPTASKLVMQMLDYFAIWWRHHYFFHLIQSLVWCTTF